MFRKKNQQQSNHFIPMTPQVYPAGVCVVTATGTYLINIDGKRYRIPTQDIELSWRFPLTVVTTEEALKNYPIAVTKLGFRDGSLLNNIADGKLYLVSESKLRHITSPEVLQRLGVNKDRFQLVSDAEIKLMKIGADIY